VNLFVRNFLDKDKDTTWNTTFQQGFFTPYKSMSDFGLELAAPFCMPMIFFLGELFLIIQIAAHLLQALTYLLVVKFSGSTDDLQYEPDAGIENLAHAATALMYAGFLAAAFVIVPVIAVISIITRLLATGYDSHPACTSTRSDFEEPRLT
jgi:hypothetical protein